MIFPIVKQTNVLQVFMKNGIDHFTDMMPALHNYITIDTDAFLSDEKRLLAIYNMCKEIFNKGKR